MLRRRYRDFPYVPCPHKSMVSPLSTLPTIVYPVKTDEFALRHHHHSKSIVYIIVHFLVLYILCVWTNIEWHVSHLSIIQTNFTILNLLFCLFSPASPHLLQTLIFFTVSISLPFAECHTVGIILYLSFPRLASFT